MLNKETATEPSIKLNVSAVEAAALLSILHPVLAGIFNHEEIGIDNIVKAVKNKDVSLLDHLSDVGQRALAASFVAAQLESKLDKLIEKEKSARA